ncbi:MAG: T9SS type A sorting domain-containing protein [Wenyingzhuangia sp.]
MNINGQRLASCTGNSINLSHLATGLYIAKIRTSKGMVSKKFIR